MFSKIAAFFHRHPGIKTTIVGGLGTAMTLAAQGTFGPKAAVVAAAVSTVAALWIKRPADATVEDKNPPPPPPKVQSLVGPSGGTVTVRGVDGRDYVVPFVRRIG